MNTDPAEFRKFVDALLANAPADYTPHLIPLLANRKDPVPTPAWDTVRARLTVQQAEERLRKGENVGIAAMKNDPLVIIDVDDVRAVPFDTMKPTLSVRTSRREGFHFFFMGGDKADNLKCAFGEVRSKNQYVVAAGSYVTPDPEKAARIPKEEKDNAGRYTVEVKRDPAVFQKRDIPRAFFENQAQLQYAQDATKSKASPELEAVKARVSIADVLDKYGHNTQRNPTQCPVCKCQCECFSYRFAQDKLFYCWNSECKHRVVGDIFHLTALLEGLTCENDFPEVLRRFSDKFGISIGGVQSPRMAEDSEQDTEEPTKTNLAYPTAHLPCFEDLNNAIGLHGMEYAACKKRQYYTTVGAMYRKQVFKYSSGIIIDSRISGLDVMRSGAGKGRIKQFRRRIAEKLDFKYDAPTSVHPDQLIGKMDEHREEVEAGKRKTKTVITLVPNPGSLNADFLDFDEARELLTAKDLNVAESRKNVRLAQDRYETNEISKRLVNHTRDQTLRYLPCVIIQQFSQAQYNYPQELVFSGDLRRPLISYITNNTAPEETYTARLRKGGVGEDEAATKYSQFLKGLNQSFFRPADESLDAALIEYAKLLLDAAHLVGRKAVGFARVLEQVMIERLLQFALLLCLARNDDKLTADHVKMAYVDLFEITLSGYRFVEERIEGEFLEGGLKPELSAILIWLDAEGGTGEEATTVTVSALDAHIMLSQKVAAEGARKVRRKLKRGGWVDYRQEGKTEHKVWLTRELPDTIKGGKGGTAYKIYLSLINYIVSYKKSSFIPDTVPPFPPSLSKQGTNETVAEVVRRLDKGDGAPVADVLAELGDGGEARLAHADKVGHTFEVAGHRDRRKVLE